MNYYQKCIKNTPRKFSFKQKYNLINFADFPDNPGCLNYKSFFSSSAWFIVRYH